MKVSWRKIRVRGCCHRHWAGPHCGEHEDLWMKSMDEMRLFY